MQSSEWERKLKQNRKQKPLLHGLKTKVMHSNKSKQPNADLVTDEGHAQSQQYLTTVTPGRAVEITSNIKSIVFYLKKNPT